MIKRTVRAKPPEPAIQRVAQAPWVNFVHLTGDAQGAREGNTYDVELVCHSCHASAVVRFSMSSITIEPTRLRGEEVDRTRDTFVAKHARCTPPADPRAWCSERAGEPETYDFSIGVS